jgi:hypothetical protein
MQHAYPITTHATHRCTIISRVKEINSRVKEKEDAVNVNEEKFVS